MRPSALLLASALTSTAAALVALTSATAHAQSATVSDADRAAARELYVQGVQLQQAGKYEPALDKFQRAQAVLGAPTHQLHIAQCQAALGKLVEAAETYRSLNRTSLAPSAPAAFQAAQAQGNAELPQVESRIPELKIDVTPASAPGLQVTIDDQTMSSALVGVSRPINAGTHKIVVSASGYGKSEQTLSIKERETKAIAVALQATSVSAAVTPGPSTASPTGTTPPTSAPGPTYYPPPTPAPYEGGAPLKTVTAQPSASFYIGARVGASIPGGSLQQDVRGDAVTIGSRAGTGGAIALEAGFRVARTIYLGVDFEGSALSGPADPQKLSTDTIGTYTSTAALAAAHLGIITNPHGVGFYGDVGAGYRVLTSTVRVESSNASSNYLELKEAYSGPELLLAAGIYIKVTEALRIIPKAQVGLGTFSNVSGTCDGSGAGYLATCQARVSDGSVAATAGHTFVFLGIGGYFGHDFK